MKQVSIVVAMYNEEAIVSHCYQKIREVMEATPFSWELIAVDDGSNDHTASILDELVKNFPHCIVIHRPHQGQGAALKSGFERAQGEAIVTLDADLSFDPKDIPRLLENLANADVVIGSPFAKGAKCRNIPPHRLWGSHLINYLDRHFLKIPVTSISTCFRAYKRKSLLAINIESISFDAQTEILMKLHRFGAVIKEIPSDLTWDPEWKRASHMKILQEIGKRIRLWRKWSCSNK